MSSKLRTQIIFTQDRKIQKIQVELLQQKKRLIVSDLSDDKPLSYYINAQQLIDIEKGKSFGKQLEYKNVKIIEIQSKHKGGKDSKNK